MGKKTTQTSSHFCKKLADKLIKQQYAMTLATAEGDKAWAAAVYYVHLDPHFYFFSDPESRHVREALITGQASAAISVAASTWQEIKGLQMSGHIREVSSGLEAAKVIGAYLKKFPFSKEFFTRIQPMDLEAFKNRFKVKLYKFSPDFILYLDNSIKFGFREELAV